jgi:hypothetical protein
MTLVQRSKMTLFASAYFVSAYVYEPFFFPRVLWNCLVWHLGPPGAGGILASVDTSLLVYKRGVPIARQPQEEAGKSKDRRDRKKHLQM